MLSTASRSENQLTVRDTAASQSTAGSQPMSVFEGKVCGKFQEFDGSTGQTTKACACVDPTATCEAPAPGSCNPGYCGTQLVCSFSPVMPGGPFCGCGQPLP